MSDLFGNPEDRFSHVAAQIIVLSYSSKHSDKIVTNYEICKSDKTANQKVISISKLQVFGVGIPNPYRLRPYLGARLPVNTSFSPLINMHNPHSSTLQVRLCVVEKKCFGFYMSCLVEKPTICICENKDADQLRGNCEADQRLCFRYSDSTIPLLLKSEISSFQLFSVLVQVSLCRTCSETTLFVFP